MDRRLFLGGLATGLAGLATRPLSAVRLSRVGLQLRSVAGALGPDLTAALQRVASIGYRDIEFWTPPGLCFDPVQIRRAMDQVSLSAPSRHVPMADVFSNWRVVLNTCRVLGNRHVVCEEVPAAQRTTLAGYAKVAELLNAAGKISQWAGMQLVVHQHVSDFQPINGVIPFEHLASHTDPGLVKFQMNLAATTRAGRDPLADLARFSGRFVSLHLSDAGGPPARSPAGLGEGVINLPAILSAASRANLQYFFVADERPESPWEHAAANFRYASELEFE
jgi:sugar phosphate isomerase/epimerase